MKTLIIALLYCSVAKAFYVTETVNKELDGIKIVNENYHNHLLLDGFIQQNKYKNNKFDDYNHYVEMDVKKKGNSFFGKRRNFEEEAWNIKWSDDQIDINVTAEFTDAFNKQHSKPDYGGAVVLILKPDGTTKKEPRGEMDRYQVMMVCDGLASNCIKMSSSKEKSLKDKVFSFFGNN